jgi:hypothetical protein
MKTLTQEQRAQRRAKRFNKRTESNLPLFSGTLAITQFLTNQVEQLQRVKQWDQICERYFQKIEIFDQEMLLKSFDLRENIEMSKRTELDVKLKTLQSHYPAFNSPEYIADFWRSNQ